MKAASAAGIVLAFELAAASRQLHFRNGTFRVAVFCDMHFGESQEKDALSMQFESKILSLETPDLVVIDGDASSNYASPDCKNKDASNITQCEAYFRSNWKNFTKPLNDAGVAYAYGLGNHDRIGPAGEDEGANASDYVVPGHWIMQVDHTNNVAMSQDGPQDIHGASNYVVPIKGAGGAPAFYIWVLDSSDNNCLGSTGWGCVYPDQVKWFRDKAEELRRRDGRVIPGLAFLHIPLPEVMLLWDEGGNVTGTKGEDVCCSSVNTGLFDAMVELGNIQGVFSGHDHGNDFVGWRNGIMIGYGRKSGHGGYMNGAALDGIGARMFELSERADGVDWRTYIRTESGIVQHQQQQTSIGTPQKICGGADQPPAGMTPTERCSFDGDRQACRAAVGLPDEDTPALMFLGSQGGEDQTAITV